MTDRWRGRRAAGLAGVLLLALATGGSVAAARPQSDPQRWLVVRDVSATELARVPLPSSGRFGLRYRNSLYQSLAEEHFVVHVGELQLVSLSADELAVLEEYYAAAHATRAAAGAGRRWKASVERPAIRLPLRIQATALGERTLLAGDREIELWRLVEGRADTRVILSVER